MLASRADHCVIPVADQAQSKRSRHEPSIVKRVRDNTEKEAKVGTGREDYRVSRSPQNIVSDDKPCHPSRPAKSISVPRQVERAYRERQNDEERFVDQEEHPGFVRIQRDDQQLANRAAPALSTHTL